MTQEEAENGAEELRDEDGLLEAQEGKGYGEDEGERDASLDDE